jgi:hypothetical protein
VNVLDESILRSQRELLRARRIRCRHVGRDLGRPGMADEDVLALLRRLGGVTFFTRDLRLAHPGLCDPRFCIVTLDVGQHEAASFIQRAVRHPALNTRARRMGAIVRVTHAGLRVWHRQSSEPLVLPWAPARLSPRR